MTQSRYDWEEKRRKFWRNLMRAFEAASEQFSGKFDVVGIAVINKDDAETAYFSIVDMDGDIATMDIMSDIFNEVQGLLDENSERSVTPADFEWDAKDDPF